MFERLGRLVAKRPRLVIGVWVAAAVILSVTAPSWDSRAVDEDIRSLPSRCPSVRGYELLAKAFPQDVFASRLVLAIERHGQPLTSADFGLVDRMAGDIERLGADDPTLGIGKVATYRDRAIGARLMSGDGQCTLLQVALASPLLAMQTRTAVDAIEARLADQLTGPDLPRVYATGQAGIGRDLTRASADGLERTTPATIILVVGVLLFVYRAPLLALVPLATIGVSLWVSLQLLTLLSLCPGFQLMTASRVFAVVMLFGAGTDYCLFLISRYEEELAHGYSPRTGVARSLAAVGGALTASAGTVICGLGLMGFAEFAKVRAAGPAIALSLAIGLAASLTLAPATLRLLGRRAFWPNRGPRANPWARLPEGYPLAFGETIWSRLSRLVVTRPLLVWTAAALPLVALAVIGVRVVPQYRPTGELSQQAASVQGLAAIERHFTAGEVGPLTVLLKSSRDWNDERGRALVGHLSRGLARLPNVAEVRSLTQPLGTPLGVDELLAKGKALGGWLGSFRKNIERAVGDALGHARGFYTACVTWVDERPCYVTRLDVVPRSGPFEPASRQTVEQVQLWLGRQLPLDAGSAGDVEAECYGATINAVDLANVTESDRARVNTLVLLAIFLILVALVRRPWLALYLLATVLLSYFATLGATALVGAVFFGRPLGEIDWRVPFFLFTILVAVGEDYNIFLVTRVLQERPRHGTIEGIRRAVAGTGGTITSCGLIMAGTFATLSLSGLGTLVQCGFALALGVLLDTFIVRPFLVPAFLVLVWRPRRADRRVASGVPLPVRRAG